MKLISIHDGHNASVAFMENGEVIFAIQEERLLRIKNAGGFPHKSLEYGLNKLKWEINEIEKFIFAGKDTGIHSIHDIKEIFEKYDTFFSPFSKRHTNIWENPKNLKKIFKSKKYKFSNFKSNNKNFKYVVETDFNNSQLERIKPLKELGVNPRSICFLEHHLCHAAAVAYGMPLQDKSLVITLDSWGDDLSGSVNIFENNKISRVHSISGNVSIARLYSLITYYLGLVPLEHEYKIMGMSPYAIDTKYAREIADTFHDLFELPVKGEIDFKLKNDHHATKELGPWIFEKLRFCRFDHISAGIQLFVEEFITNWIKVLIEKFEIKNLGLSGGLFMNVKLNQRINELDEVDSIKVFPSCGDETNVFGALYYYFSLVNNTPPSALRSFYFGSEIDESEIKKEVEKMGVKNPEIKVKKYNNIEREIAKLLSKNNVVARCKGRMEFGARALGNRSILAPANSANAVTEINKMIKKRDFWMPFAPAMINSGRYLKKKESVSSYMMQTFDVKEEFQNELIAVCQQYDKTCRVQDVSIAQNKDYFTIIEEYEKLTGIGVIMNTSFNLHGYPIVNNAYDAIHVFMNSGLNYLALGDYLFSKNN